MINQSQLFFLFLITRAYIPKGVQTVITGPEFTVNPFQFIPISKPENTGTYVDGFNFDLNNDSLSNFQINSLSTIYNTYSFFQSLLYAIALHLVIWLMRKFVFKLNTEGK